MKKIRTSIRFDEKTREVIKEIGKKTHRNMSQVIEHAIWDLALVVLKEDSNIKFVDVTGRTIDK